MNNTLIVLTGPTGVGKTELSLKLAEKLRCSIVSSDSRQIFRELKIGTAAPDERQLQRVPHYFIGTKSIVENYNAGQYESDALTLLEHLFTENRVQMLVGGSMLYIDALCRGLDEIPTISDDIRSQVNYIFEKEGIKALQEKLLALDPVYYKQADLNNHRRVAHALEVSIATGKPYSELLRHEPKKRPFDIIKIGLNLPREELYERINRRVDEMIQQGLLDEAKRFYPQKELNSLKTVGYRELFDFWDGKYATLDDAVGMIKQNSRRYAKRQLTWFRADREILWFAPTQYDEIVMQLEKEGIL